MAYCRAMASPDKSDEVVMLYKSLIEQSDSKSLIIKQNMDFLLAFRCPLFCNKFITLVNLSMICAREQGAEC